MYPVLMLEILVLPELFEDKYLLCLLIYIFFVYLTTFAIAQNI